MRAPTPLPDVRDIIEVRYKTVPVVGTGEAFRLRDLRAEVTKDQDGWCIRPDQDRPYEKLKLVH